LELIILGSSAAYPGAGRACSGYLIKEDKSHLLLDIGTGALSNLLRWLNPSELDGLVITHLHPDHFLDIYPLRFFLQIDGDPAALPLKVLAPSGASEFIIRLIDEDSKGKFFELFDFNEIQEGAQLKVGRINLTFHRVPHSIDTYAVVVDEKKLVYTSDCAYDNSLLELAKGAEVFLCEATLQKPIFPGHLTAAQAGKIAQKAGVKRLVLTHIWPSFDPEISKKEAKEVFDGEVIIAKENQSYSL